MRVRDEVEGVKDRIQPGDAVQHLLHQRHGLTAPERD